MGIVKKLRHRIKPKEEDVLRFRSLVSDSVHRRNPFAKRLLGNMLYRYFFGDLIHRRYYQGVREELTEPKPLYHLTYSANIPSIRKNGLRGRDFVFLTDDPAYGRGYFRWKDPLVDLGASGEHTILEIDAAKLMRLGHPVYFLERKLQLMTDAVPPECIARASAYPDK